MEPEPEPQKEYRCAKCNAPANWNPYGGAWMCRCGSRSIVERIKARPVLPPEPRWRP